MGHLHLIIKGDRKAAYAAAKEYGVELHDVRPARRSHPEILATCEDGFRPQVQHWFLAPPLDAPFPVGTLLHWSEQTRV